jgi:hypothetical protein
MLTRRLLSAAGGGGIELILQTLTGSGTFTPLYAGVPAIIQIGGGGGGGGAYVESYGGDPSYLYGRSGNAGAGDASFTLDIDDFDGGSYAIGSGGSGSGGCAQSSQGYYGGTGTLSSFRSAGNNPYTIYAGKGGRGGWGPNPYDTNPSDPMSGTYPTDTSELPDEVEYNDVEIDPLTLMALSTGGSGGNGGSAQVDRPPEGGTIPGCAYGGSGGAGFIRIYYLT